jgi:hypothetical protein
MRGESNIKWTFVDGKSTQGVVVRRFQGVARHADDKDSKALKGAGTYRLTVLANAPIQQ